MRGNVVSGKTDDFYTTFFEFRFLACNLAEFGGANRSEIVGVREKDSP